MTTTKYIYIYKKYSLFLHETMYTHIYIKYISVTHEDNAYVNSYNEIIQHFDMLKFSFLWIAYGCNMLCGLRRRSWLFNGTAWCRHRRCVYHWRSHLLFNSIVCECCVQDPCERKWILLSLQQQLTYTLPVVTKGCVWTAQSPINMLTWNQEKHSKEFIEKTCT